MQILSALKQVQSDSQAIVAAIKNEFSVDDFMSGKLGEFQRVAEKIPIQSPGVDGNGRCEKSQVGRWRALYASSTEYGCYSGTLKKKTKLVTNWSVHATSK